MIICTSSTSGRNIHTAHSTGPEEPRIGVWISLGNTMMEAERQDDFRTPEMIASGYEAVPGSARIPFAEGDEQRFWPFYKDLCLFHASPGMQIGTQKREMIEKLPARGHVIG